jgi:rhodanese-related sulfurtransferase
MARCDHGKGIAVANHLHVSKRAQARMPNPYNAPEISPEELAAKRQAGAKFVVLDVREPSEYELAHMGHDWIDHAPVSELAKKKEAALPPPARNKEAEIVVVCHHGMRSAQVAAWLLQLGYQNVRSLCGGIDAYARKIDPSIGTY